MMKDNKKLDRKIRHEISGENELESDNQTADFLVDSTLGSATEPGFADDVLSVENTMSSSYLEHKQHSILSDQDQIETYYLDKIIVLLHSSTGHDFSSYKKNFIQRRIKRCMGIYQIDNIVTYVTLLEENPQELKLLWKEFLIGVTRFFREPVEWELLKNKVIPELLVQRSPNDALRVWISGCSTGEEAYSLAIVCNEVMEQLEYSKDFSMQIFATDLDCKSIDKAREAIFSIHIADDMSTERLNQYFIKVDRGYQVVKSIRDRVIFAQQNMIQDPPFTQIDILICRNLLIYLIPEIQKKIIPLFHYSLNSGGFLFLGSGESVRNFTDLFRPLALKSRIYQRIRPLIQTDPIEYHPFFTSAQYAVQQPSDEEQNIESLAYKMVLQSYSPATVFVNAKGDILYISGRTGKYLEPVAGKANWNILSMARQGLSYRLSEAFYQALRKKEAVTVKNTVVMNESGPLMVDISINLLKDPGALYGMVMVVFTDVIISNINEIEEFKSSSEKMQLCNEELQSTNKELNILKDVLQSSNEELKASNFRLQAKLDNLLLETNDIEKLTNSMNVAALLLDHQLIIKRFTTQMTKVSRLIYSDVGRPITDIVSNLMYPELTEDIKDVQRTLITVEKQVISSKGSWFNARILPCNTLDEQDNDIVITFEDITTLKKAKVVFRRHCRSRSRESNEQ